MAEIKWRKKDLTKLTNYVRKFNASITNLSKKNPEIADAGLYPAKINIQNMKETIKTRKDFNDFIRRTDNWFKPKSKDIITHDSGLKTTRWSLKEAKLAEKRINKRIKNIQSKINITLPEGMKIKTGLEQISVDEKLNQLSQRVNDKSFNNNTTIENEMNGWNMFVHSLLTKSSEGYFDLKNENYYQNYIFSLYQNLSFAEAQAIHQMITDLGLNGYQLYLMSLYDTRLTIDYIYDEDTSSEKFSELLSYFPKVYQEISNV